MRPLIFRSLILFLFVAVTAGCSVKPPTIAHVHIGHAVTGWVDTPDNQSLLAVAEHKAKEALRYSQSAVSGKNDFFGVKADIEKAVQASKRSESHGDTMVKYDVLTAVEGVINHITYASTSEDASANVKQFAEGLEAKAMTIIDRCELISAYGEEIRRTNSTDEAGILADEILVLAKANVLGSDENGDTVVGNEPGEYGLVQVRRDIEEMIARENPPYETVDTWYLFNLIRLPSGIWKFKPRTQSHSGIGGGNGGGGY